MEEKGHEKYEESTDDVQQPENGSDGTDYVKGNVDTAAFLHVHCVNRNVFGWTYVTQW